MNIYYLLTIMKYSFVYIYFYRIFILQFNKYIKHKNINIHKKIVIHL